MLFCTAVLTAVPVCVRLNALSPIFGKGRVGLLRVLSITLFGIRYTVINLLLEILFSANSLEHVEDAVCGLLQLLDFLFE